MNKKFSTKKKRIKLRFFFTFLMLLLGIYASYKDIEKKRIVLTDKELIKTTTKKVKRNEEIKRILG